MRLFDTERFNKKRAIVWLLIVIDWATIFFSLFLAQWLRFSTGILGPTSPLSRQNLLLLLPISGFWILILAGYGLYKERNFFPIMDQLFRVLKSVVMGTVLLLVLVFILKAHAHLQSRLFVACGFLISLASLSLWRGLIFSKLIYSLFGQKGLGRRALIVGTGERGRQLARHIAECPSLGLEVVGFIANVPKDVFGKDVAATDAIPKNAISTADAFKDNASQDTVCADNASSNERPALGNLSVLGTTEDIPTIVKRYDIGEIFLGVPSLSHGELVSLIDTCKATQLPVTLTSELLDVVCQHSPVGKIDGIPTVTIQPKGFSEVSLVLKRVIDLTLGCLVLTMFAPVLIVAGLLIKIDSRGPIFFKQRRLGKNGRSFTIYKLRTMVVNENDDIHRRYSRDFIARNSTAGCDQNGDKLFKLDNDPRITSVGKILRRLSLDELPQLLNVIRGEMSLVGPRPPLPYEAELYKDWHNKRLQVKPGITGLWQVTARSAVGFDDMVMLDLYYVEHWSLLFDFQLMLKTIPAAFSGKGAL